MNNPFYFSSPIMKPYHICVHMKLSYQRANKLTVVVWSKMTLPISSYIWMLDPQLGELCEKDQTVWPFGRRYVTEDGLWNLSGPDQADQVSPLSLSHLPASWGAGCTSKLLLQPMPVCLSPWQEWTNYLQLSKPLIESFLGHSVSSRQWNSN